jgi:hypothetical protein
LLKLFNLIVTLQQRPFEVSPNQLMRVDIAVELLDFRLSLCKILSEFAILVQQTVVLLGEQLVFDFEVFGCS